MRPIATLRALGQIEDDRLVELAGPQHDAERGKRPVSGSTVAPSRTTGPHASPPAGPPRLRSIGRGGRPLVVRVARRAAPCDCAVAAGSGSRRRSRCRSCGLRRADHRGRCHDHGRHGTVHVRRLAVPRPSALCIVDDVQIRALNRIARTSARLSCSGPTSPSGPAEARSTVTAQSSTVATSVTKSANAAASSGHGTALGCGGVGRHKADATGPDRPPTAPPSRVLCEDAARGAARATPVNHRPLLNAPSAVAAASRQPARCSRYRLRRPAQVSRQRRTAAPTGHDRNQDRGSRTEDAQQDHQQPPGEHGVRGHPNGAERGQDRRPPVAGRRLGQLRQGPRSLTPSPPSAWAGSPGTSGGNRTTPAAGRRDGRDGTVVR